jgi:hypothetical protein
MAGVGKNNQSSSVRGIESSDGSIYLLSDRLASLNFNGFIPRTSTEVYASDLTVGQTIFNANPISQDDSFFITKIDAFPVVVDGVDEQKYFLYFLGDENLEEPYTYGAENEDGSFSQDHLFSSYRDDISSLSLGTDGWMITNQGNAVFSNVFVRGTIEATSGKIDGILNVGEDVNGEPLVTIGKNLFESTSFEGNSSEHSGIFLDRHNYFMGYDQIKSIPILSVVAQNSTNNVILRKAEFTLANHTLSVADKVSISGFTEDKFLELEDTFSIAEVTPNTFTVYYKKDIAGTTNPITVDLKADSFGLDDIYTITQLNLVNVVSTEDTSILHIYVAKEYIGEFEEGFPITVTSFTSPVFEQSSRYSVDSIVETPGEDDPDYLVTTSLRVTAGTYTTGLGQIDSSLKNYKFKVGNDTNSMSYNSFTGALTVTGTINADSGNFTNNITVGKQNISYSVYNKKLLGNVATLATSTFHNFVIGDEVVVSGVDATFNGTYTITGVPTLESFTYAKTASNVASTAVSPLGTVSIGEPENGNIFVGYGANQITISGTELSTTSSIFSGAGSFKDPFTPFYMDASGRFSISDQLYFESGVLTAPGIAATSIAVGTAPNRIIISPTAVYGSAGLYIENTEDFINATNGNFSLGDGRVTWDTASLTLTVDGILKGFVNDTTPITANPGNTMGFGLFSTGSVGVGLKINDNNYWFADAGNPRIRVGSANNYLSYQSSSDLLEVTGTINANAGSFGTFLIDTSGVSGTNDPALWGANGKDVISLDTTDSGLTGFPGISIDTYDRTLPNPIWQSTVALNEFGLWFQNRNTTTASYIESDISGFGIAVSLGEGAEDYPLISASYSNPIVIKSATISGVGSEFVYSVINKQLTSNIATLTTDGEHALAPGSTIVVSGVDSIFNGRYTVIDTPTLNTFTYAKTETNVVSTVVSPAGKAAASYRTTATLSFGVHTVTAVNDLNPDSNSATYTANGHTFNVGDTVIISGASIAGFNGTFTITAVTTNTFRVANTTTGNPSFSTGSVSLSSLKLLATDQIITATGLVTPLTITAIDDANPGSGFVTYTATGHTFFPGDLVTITGASVAGFNGTFGVYDVTANTFTIQSSTTGATSTASVFSPVRVDSVAATNVTIYSDNLINAGALSNISTTYATFTHSGDRTFTLGQQFNVSGVSGGNYNNFSTIVAIDSDNSFTVGASNNNFTSPSGSGGTVNYESKGNFVIKSINQSEEFLSISPRLEPSNTLLTRDTFSVFNDIFKINSRGSEFPSGSITTDVSNFAIVNSNGNGLWIDPSDVYGVYLTPAYNGVRQLASQLYFDGPSNRWRFEPPVYMNSTLRVVGTSTLTGNVAFGGGVDFGALSIASAGSGTISSTGGIALSATNGGVTLSATNGGVTLSATNDITLSATDDVILNPISELKGNVNVYSSANLTGRTLLITSSPYVIGTSASTRRVKQQISDFQWDVDALLNLSPKVFKYNKSVEEFGESAPWVHGLIAEEIGDLGLEGLIQRDEEGIPDYVEYDKIGVALISVVKNQQLLIEDLENRLAALES